MRPAKAAKAVPPSDTQRIADALVHFEIGLRTHSAGLPVDWSYVAYRMAVALGSARRAQEQEWDGDGVAAQAAQAAQEVRELGPATRFVLREVE